MVQYVSEIELIHRVGSWTRNNNLELVRVDKCWLNGNFTVQVVTGFRQDAA